MLTGSLGEVGSGRGRASAAVVWPSLSTTLPAFATDVSTWATDVTTIPLAKLAAVTSATTATVACALATPPGSTRTREPPSTHAWYPGCEVRPRRPTP